jgi:hypothetical protein
LTTKDDVDAFLADFATGATVAGADFADFFVGALFDTGAFFTGVVLAGTVLVLAGAEVLVAVVFVAAGAMSVGTPALPARGLGVLRAMMGGLLAAAMGVVEATCVGGG